MNNDIEQFKSLVLFDSLESPQELLAKYFNGLGAEFIQFKQGPLIFKTKYYNAFTPKDINTIFLDEKVQHKVSEELEMFIKDNFKFTIKFTSQPIS